MSVCFGILFKYNLDFSYINFWLFSIILNAPFFLSFLYLFHHDLQTDVQATMNILPV